MKKIIQLVSGINENKEIKLDKVNQSVSLTQIGIREYNEIIGVSIKDPKMKLSKMITNNFFISKGHISVIGINQYGDKVECEFYLKINDDTLFLSLDYYGMY